MFYRVDAHIFHNKIGDVQNTDYGEWIISARNPEEAEEKLADFLHEVTIFAAKPADAEEEERFYRLAQVSLDTLVSMLSPANLRLFNKAKVRYSSAPKDAAEIRELFHCSRASADKVFNVLTAVLTAVPKPQEQTAGK